MPDHLRAAENYFLAGLDKKAGLDGGIVAMNPNCGRQIDQIFLSALNREPNEGGGLVAKACGGDEALHREVELPRCEQAPSEETPSRPSVELLGCSTLDHIAACAGLAKSPTEPISPGSLL